MAWRKETFLAIQSLINSKMPEIKAVELYNNQFEDYKGDFNEEAPLLFPLVLIDFVGGEWEHQGDTRRSPAYIIELHLGIESYKASYSGALDQSTALDHLDMISTLANVLDRQNLDHAFDFSFFQEQIDTTKTHLIEHILTFSAQVIDCSLEQLNKPQEQVIADTEVIATTNTVKTSNFVNYNSPILPETGYNIGNNNNNNNPPAIPSNRKYVRASASGANTGANWTNAYLDLQDALQSSSFGDVIWVAQGTYYPTNSTDRTISFVVPNGVQVLGGFAGTEYYEADRKWKAYPTILSGDLGTTGDLSENSYHVLAMTGVSANTVLDGLIIERGNANALTYPNDRGGGIFLDGANLGNLANPIFRNCIFRNNHALYGGGAVNALANSGGQTNYTCVNCLFADNTTQGYGGAILNATFNLGNNNSKIINCTFVGNYAIIAGYAIANLHANANVQVQNSIIWDLNAFFATSAIHIIYSIYRMSGLPSGVVDGGNNLYATNPLFLGGGGYELSTGSPAINNASLALLPSGIEKDLATQDRVSGIGLDMGAYEYQ